jgi:glycosyltransferase involved in cell wall biosynthesis
LTTGIIGYLSPRGLGTMTHDLRVQLGIQHQLVPVDAGWAYVQEWATGNEIYLDNLHVQREDLEIWKDVFGIDTVVSIETSYGDQTFKWAKELGMKTILIVMWESFNPHMQAYKDVDVYIAPSFKAFQEIPFDNKRFLPYPVDTDLFKYRQRSGLARTFIHNAGSGGLNGRKGTLEAISGFLAARNVCPSIRLIVRSQKPLSEIVPEMNLDDVPGIEVYGPSDRREELYEDGDVMIYTSKYDGHALVTLEAMAAGLPVITTNAPPMNEFWPPHQRNLLVKVEKEQKLNLVNPHCMGNLVSIPDLTEKIIWCANNDMSVISALNRGIVEKEHSWNLLRERWRKVLL